MSVSLEQELKKMRNDNCCSTTSVLNMFSRCLCIKTSKVSSQPPAKELAAAGKELFIQKRFFEEQPRPKQMKKKFAFSSIPRVPLSIRAKQSSFNEAGDSTVQEVRPITQLVGSQSKVDRRKARSVSVWA